MCPTRRRFSRFSRGSKKRWYRLGEKFLDLVGEEKKMGPTRRNYFQFSRGSKKKRARLEEDFSNLVGITQHFCSKTPRLNRHWRQKVGNHPGVNQEFPKNPQRFSKKLTSPLKFPKKKPINITRKSFFNKDLARTLQNEA